MMYMGTMYREIDRGGQGSNLPLAPDVYGLIETAGGASDRAARIAAVDALGASGDPRAVQTLVQCLQDADSGIRMHAACALRDLPSVRAVGALIERLLDTREQSETRVHAAEALGRIRSIRAIDPLTRILQEPDDRLREAAENALTEIKHAWHLPEEN